MAPTLCSRPSGILCCRFSLSAFPERPCTLGIREATLSMRDAQPGKSFHISYLVKPGNSVHISYLTQPGNSFHISYLAKPGNSVHISYLTQPGNSFHIWLNLETHFAFHISTWKLGQLEISWHFTPALQIHVCL